MTIQQLEYIVALDNHRHFVKAAAQCFVTQPTLSMQVKKLEEEFGLQIFDRNKKVLTPTDTGIQIILKARQILREVRQMGELISSQMQSMEGTFRLGIIPTLAPYLLPRFLPDFVKNNPNTKLIIKELQTEDIMFGLKNDQLDIGLLVTPLMESEIREIPLFNEPFLAFFPKEHPFITKKEVRMEDLDAKKLLVLTDGHCFRNQTLNICDISKTSQTMSFDYQSGSIEALVNLVNKGLGYTLIPELSINKNLADNQIKRFKAPEPIREVSIVVHNSFPKETLIEQLRDQIINNIPKSMLSKKKFVRVKWR